jgi:hypothetical protein
MIGYKHTKESRLKMSIAKKGKPSHRKGTKHTEETRKKMRLNHRGMSGKKVSEETKKKMSLSKKGKLFSKEHLENLRKSHLGQKAWNAGLTKEVDDRVRMRVEVRKRMSETHRLRKKESHLWKGGINPVNDSIRKSIEFKLWRESIFSRDGWTCQKTGVKGGKLNAHHIKNFSQFPELRFAIDNGVTLSVESHREFHKRYGTKNNTTEQLKEFLQ